VGLALAHDAFGSAMRGIVADVSAAAAIPRVISDVDAQVAAACVAGVAGE
jgi:hypothetical protein